MKIRLYATLMVLFVGLTIAPLGFAQDSPQWQLPDGAKMRLGKGSLYDFAYSPDGTQLAVASGIGIWIYDAQTGEALNLFTGGNKPIRIVTFSPDGKTLASDIDDNVLCLWDVNSGRQLRRFHGLSHYYVTDIAFNPDGKSIAGGDSSGDVHVWDIENRKQLYRVSVGGSWTTSIAYSPDGKLLAASDSNGKWIYLFDAYTGRGSGNFPPWLIGHTEGVSSLAFSPDGKTLASGSYDDTIILWDVDSILAWSEGTELQWDIIRRHADNIYDIVYSPDGRYLATASKDKTVQLWNTSNLSRQHTFRDDTHYTLDIAFSPDGQTITSRHSDGTIRMRSDRGSVNNRFGWGERVITGHLDTSIGFIDISPDGNTLVTEGVDNALNLWDVNTGTQQHSLIGHTSHVRTVVYSPNDNTLIASGSNDGTLRLWNADTGTERATLITVDGDVESVAFSPDGNTVACAITYGEYNSQSYLRDSNILVFDVATGTTLQTIIAHIAPPSYEEKQEFHPIRHVYPVSNIKFTHDGKTLVSSSRDSTIRFWDVETGDHLRLLKRELGHIWIQDLAFSADGKVLAGGTDRKNEVIEIWDVTNLTPKHTLTMNVDDVQVVVLNPNGTSFVGLNKDGNIYLWDTPTGRLLSTYNGHKGYVYEVAFLPDGSTIATGGADGTILLWDTTVRLPSDTGVSLSPNSLVSPVIGEQFTLSVNIIAGQSVAGYQATVNYDTTALRYVESANGDYLPPTAYRIDPIVDGNAVTLGATTFAEVAYDDGTLATITFEVIGVKDSAVTLSDVILTDLYGNSTTPQIAASTKITVPEFLPEDVNQDGVVDILDLSYVASNIGKTGRHEADINNDGVVNIVDLALVAAAIGSADAAAPKLWSDNMPTRATVEAWLQEARGLNLPDPAFQRGILVLEQLLRNLTPKETALLPNYPNPFNPETWLPYQLASASDVRITIYASDGKLVRQLDLGYRAVGVYQSRGQAAYWDGKNAIGERVASGVYFYTLTAGDFSGTRKMLIRK